MLLTVDQLKVKFGACTALDIQRSICIEEGDRVGIIGSNGAGKSTFVKSVVGLVPYKGTMRKCGNTVKAGADGGAYAV